MDRNTIATPAFLSKMSRTYQSKVAFLIDYFSDDTLAKEIETNIRVDVLMTDTVNFFDVFKFRKDMFLNRAFVDAVILTIR